MDSYHSAQTVPFHHTARQGVPRGLTGYPQPGQRSRHYSRLCLLVRGAGLIQSGPEDGAAGNQTSVAARIRQPSGAPGVGGGPRSKHASRARSTAHAAPSWVAGRVGPVPTARSTLRRRRCRQGVAQGPPPPGVGQLRAGEIGARRKKTAG